ncbi:MAG TPA: hypothetical protein VN603_03565 [Candidatus Acidoferrales bacterium]|nr:hypothetical protein [Candidatus Acidoferrales bacterium]
MTPTAPALDQQRLEAFVGKAIGDIGAAMSAALVVIGDKLGLYKTLDRDGPLTSAELADRTGTHERYVREWLANQSAGGYLEYDPKTAKYRLPPEQAFMLADDSSALCVQGLFCTPASLSQEVRLGLGAQCGEQRMREVATEAGFTRFRRAAETPFNLVYELRK